jgi:hypothetical protein
MSSIENPRGHEHIGDEFVTYNRHSGEERTKIILSPISSQVQRKRKRHMRKQKEGQIMRQILRQRGG